MLKSKHPLYTRWNSIRQRCLNSKNARYSDYGGRGIKMYITWAEDFNTFIKYVESLPNYDLQMTLDRIDNNKGYEPGNLRWTSYNTQLRNRRSYAKSGMPGLNYRESRDSWVGFKNINGKHITKESKNVDIVLQWLCEKDVK